MELDDSIFGCDYSSKGEINANGDIGTIEGLDNAKQNIRNWLLTQKGFYPFDDEYGCEIFDIFGEDFEEENVDAGKVYILNALYDNPRVKEVKRIEPYITINGDIRFIIEIMLVNGTEEQMTVELEE